MTKSIMIVGVGGQGTLLASRLIGHVLVEKGLDVKLSEVHGMSQRGGSVVTYVKYGDKVYSPMVDKGEADYILSFEAVEGARYLEMLKKGGTLITNTHEIYPITVISGATTYPDAPVKKLSEICNVKAVDALTLAKEAGSDKAVNTVLLGMLSVFMPEIELDSWLNAIDKLVKPKFVELNKKAFLSGRAV
ncbi:MAG: indolepyruvate oxidoreductase subunit beta [Clostridia bacterium]|nr:indolepyruvate oxidoreductase subunit beta [Clostridia bacterium]